MIQTSLLKIPLLKDFAKQQYLQKSRLLIRWNLLMDIVIYKFDSKFQYFQYKISLRTQMLGRLMIEFIDSIQYNCLLGVGISKTEFVIFAIDLEKQDLLQLKKIAINRFQQFGYVLQNSQTHAYKLENDNFNVIDFSDFPEVFEYTFASNIDSFDIIYFETCHLIKLTNRLGQYQFYLLPLSKQSQPVKFNENFRISIFPKDQNYELPWNSLIGKITSIYFYHQGQMAVGYYYKPSFHKFKFIFRERFLIQFDGQDSMKMFQIRAGTKLIRKWSNVIKLISLQGSRMLYARIDFTSAVYDFSTGQDFSTDAPKMIQLIEGQFCRSILIEQDLQNLMIRYAVERKNDIQ